MLDLCTTHALIVVQSLVLRLLVWDWAGTLMTPAFALSRVENLLARLRQHTHAILTNGSQAHVALQVRTLGWEPYFVAIQGGDRFQKPDPRAMYTLLASLGQNPGPEVVMIGDSECDVECARQTGCSYLRVGEQGTPLAALTEMSAEDFERLVLHDG